MFHSTDDHISEYKETNWIHFYILCLLLTSSLSVWQFLLYTNNYKNLHPYYKIRFIKYI